MKKKILSLLVTGCLLFVPTTAFADDNKTVIKTVDDLLAFSKAVNNGDYDKNKDAVVVLENCWFVNDVLHIFLFIIFKFVYFTKFNIVIIYTLWSFPI